MLDIMDDEDLNNYSFMKFIKSDPDEDSMCNTDTDREELMEFRTEKHDILRELGSYRTNEQDNRISQPKMSWMEQGKQQQIGRFVKDSNFKLNLDLGDKEGILFGGFHDSPSITKGMVKKHCKRQLELSPEQIKRQRYMDKPDNSTEWCAHKTIPKPFCPVDEGLIMGNSLKKYGDNDFGASYVAEGTTGLYHNTGIFEDDILCNTVTPNRLPSFGESYDVVSGSLLSLRLKDVAKKLDPSLSLPSVDSGNYLLGEPLRDIISNTNGTNQNEPSLISHNIEQNLLLIDDYNKENVIDPRVIFKFEADSSCPRGINDYHHNFSTIPLPQRNNNALGHLDTNRNYKGDTNVLKKVIPTVDENILPHHKKTILLTYPTPDPVPDPIPNREFNSLEYNKADLYARDLAEYDQKVIKRIDASKPAPKTKARISQKLIYIHNLSRSSTTKIDETVAYLHYKLRGYENMAVLTRIRNILQSHQLNLIGICGQLGIPELLVPRRTN